TVSLYGGAISNSGALILRRSTLNGNTSDYEGGGVYTDFYGTLDLTNCTITGNHANFYGGAIFNGSPLVLGSATLVGNTANRIGGGVYNDFFGTLSLNNSIIADNTAPESPEVFGTWTGASNLTGGDPKLSPLDNWGGLTQTMPPLPDSPAIDAGGTTALLTDQRGLARILGDSLDIGAFETPAVNFNADGLTIYARVPVTDSDGVFEISTDPNFLPVVSTLAGTGNPGLVDGARLSAQFGYPSGVVQDTEGNIFIADAGNHRIRMISPDGTVVTIAGSGANGGMANGSGPTAAFRFPSAVAVGPDANVYVADTYNHRICKLVRPSSPGGVWVVENVAGTGANGLVNGSGVAAKFNYPYGLALDENGNVYVADTDNHCIRKIAPVTSSTVTVSTYAGVVVDGAGVPGFLDSTNALAAKFNKPVGVVISSGNLYVADTLNHLIREIVPNGSIAGAVSTFAGSTVGFADGTGAAAKFNAPSGLATDGGGSLYVADEDNHRIRRITALGDVTTLAGMGGAGFVNGSSLESSFNSPTAVTVALDGNLVVADFANHVLRRTVIQPLSVPSSLVAGTVDAAGVQVNAVLDVVALGLDPSVTYYFRWKSSTTGDTQLLGQRFFLYDFPVVVTEIASNLNPTSARMNATVDPKASATAVVFVYSTDPEMGNPYEVTALAGSGEAGFADGTGAAARFSNPSGMVTDAAGDVFVADRLNHRIRKITPAGVVTTFAGSGVAGFANGTRTAARFEKPSGIAIDRHGDFYVADEWNHQIRKITATGEVTTFAGTGVAGFLDGDKAAAQFLYPVGVAVDASNNVYVADTGNHRIRKINAVTGEVTTIGGTGVDGFSDGVFSASSFSSPRALAVIAVDKVMVVDSGNQRIRVIASGSVYTLAGNGDAGFLDGWGGSARFSSPTGIVRDGAGIAYVTDAGNHRIRRITPDGQVTTLAGSGIAGQENSPAVGLYPVTVCQFDGPAGIALDPSGGVLVSQEGLVRKLARSANLPSVTVTPNVTGAGERTVFVDIPQPLLPGGAYYFQASGSNYRGSMTGEILGLVTPQAAISVFAGADTSAPAVLHEQSDPIDYGHTPTNGPSITKSFTIANPGGWPLTVSSVDVPAGYRLTGGTGVIPALASLTFELILPSLSGGVFSGGIVISSDAPGQAVFSFPITGAVLAPPKVATLSATAVGPGAATLNATVNPMGSSTTVWFEWSQDPEFDGFMVRTAAGSTHGYAEGPGATAKFNQPSGVATDAGGSIYVADTQNHRIRRIASNGTVSTLAGTGVAGFADGAGATAQFDHPVGVVMSASGILFVADSQNHRIRAINPAGEVVTYSGLGTPGFTNGIAGAARFHTPTGLAIDGDGVLYVADSDNHRIRKIAIDGSVSTLAGTGVAGSANGAVAVVQFNRPAGIAADSSGFVYVTEATSHAVRKITPSGSTSIFAGSPTTADFVNASGLSARFSSPVGLAVGTEGSLYVADQGNHRIRAVSPGGSVTTLVGSGTPGTVDGMGDDARFSSPISLSTAETGDVVVGESGSSVIRELTSLQVVQQAAAGLNGTTDIPVQLPVTGLPTAAAYFFRSIATNRGGTTVGNAVASVTTTYQAWKVAKFGVDADNPLIAGESASPAGDGVANLLKYAFGLEPLVPATGSLPTMDVGGGALALTYTQVLAATDIVYTVEWSFNLVDWSPVGVTEEILSGNGTAQLIRASVAAAPAAAKFLRLNVTLP
ncbi:MAG: hypothetical protein K9N23_10030, partial [Akkermansiaceae bacterium]|nr:hypothetical protein [Akkermansiaceae bacterium]